jgi:hypothetical protein
MRGSEALKRDLGLVRDLLLEFEATHENWAFSFDEEEESFEYRQYQGKLMTDAGLLYYEGHGCYRMTWQGHDFLDSVRDPEIWRRTLEGAEKAKGFTFDLLRDLAKGFIRTKLKEHTGIDV